MNSAKKDLLKNIIIAEQMKKELEKRRRNIIIGKLRYLLEENNRDEDCFLTAQDVEELIEEINRLGKKDCFIQDENKVQKSIISVINFGRYVLLNETSKDGNNRMCIMEKEFVEDKIGNSMPKGKITIDELFKEKKKYTLTEFLRDSTKAAVPGILPVEMVQAKRPLVVCADGFSLSIQASNGHYCEPCENVRTDYKSLELAKVSEKVDELEKYLEPGSDLAGYNRAVFGYVPRELVEKILDAHGGIDKEKTIGRVVEEVER